MPEHALSTLVRGGGLYDSLRWHSGRWWASDLYEGVVVAIQQDGHAERVMTVAGQPSGLGWMPDGSLLVVSMHDRRLLRRSPTGEVTVHADLAELLPFPANDMVVDAAGRAFVGTFGFDLFAGADPAPGVLVRVDPDGGAKVVAEQLMFPNGSVITADGRTLIVGESAASRYTAFTLAESGELADRRVWAQLGPLPKLGSLAELSASSSYSPDGCALDADGRIWAADASHPRCCLIAPGGELVEQIELPTGLSAFACALGGEDGRTLLISAGPGFSAETGVAEGAILLTTTVAAPRAGRP